MIIYRIKHTPSGLYWHPVKEKRKRLPNGEYFMMKTNLTRQGYLYVDRPKDYKLWTEKYFHPDDQSSNSIAQIVRFAKRGEFVIEEIDHTKLSL